MTPRIFNGQTPATASGNRAKSIPQNRLVDAGPNVSNYPLHQTLPEANPTLARKLAAPTRSELSEYARLKDQGRAIERRLDALGKKIKAYALAKQGDTQRYGYRVALVAGQVRPAWKDHFISRLGELAAAEVVASTSPSLSLVVERS